jgi:RNA-directed DNA polymerase
MQESHDEGPAGHIDPESCGGVPKGAAEALAGAHTGQPSSCEINRLRGADAVTRSGRQHHLRRQGEPQANPAQSQNLKEGQSFRRMCGNSLHGNRDTSRSPAGDGPAGRSAKADGRTADRHGREEPDDRVVPEKAANQKVDCWTFWERKSASLRRIHELEEKAMGRRSTEGNAGQAATVRTQSRAAVSIGLQRVREAAQRPLLRQTPEVRAVCGNAARTDLCGGPPARAVPTAPAHPAMKVVKYAS